MSWVDPVQLKKNEKRREVSRQMKSLISLIEESEAQDEEFVNYLVNSTEYRRIIEYYEKAYK